MTDQTEALKAEIKAEIHNELANRPTSNIALYVNVSLLVAIGLVAGFILGRTYERQLLKNSAEFARQQTPAEPHGGETGVRPSEPPMASVGGGDPMAEVLALRARLEENPDDVEALVELARLNTVIGRNPKAIEYLQRAIAIEPSNVDLLLELGSIQHEVGRSDDAIQSYHLAETLDTDRPWRSQLALAVLYMTAKQDRGRALEYFQRYLDAAPASDPYRESVEQEVARIRQGGSGEARQHGPDAPDTSIPEASHPS